MLAARERNHIKDMRGVREIRPLVRNSLRVFTRS